MQGVVTSKKIFLLWSILWLTLQIFICVMFYLPNDQRINVPYGQYVFFIIGLITSAILMKYYHRQIFENVSKIFLLWLFLLFGMCFVSGVLGLAPFYSVRLLAIVFITSLPFMLIGILSTNFLRSKVIYPILFFGFLSAFGAVFLQYYGEAHIFGLMVNNYHWGATRWSFVFHTANDFGQELALVITAFLYGVLMVSSAKKQGFLLILLMPLLFVLYKANSRSSMLWAVSSIFIFCVLCIVRLREYFRWSAIKYKFVFLSFLILYALLVISLTVLSANYLRINTNDVNLLTSYRWQYWVVMLKAVGHHLFLGYGYGGTQIFLGNKDALPGNIYIDFLGQTGIFGFGILLVFWFGGIFLSIKYIVKSWKIDRQLSFFATFILMLLCGLALRELGDSFSLVINELNYLFFFAITAAYALPFAYNRSCKNNNVSI